MNEDSTELKRGAGASNWAMLDEWQVTLYVVNDSRGGEQLADRVHALVRESLQEVERIIRAEIGQVRIELSAQ